MTKRIAIQLFGHLRSFRKTHESFFKYIVQPNIDNGYDVDIFIHTWNETDHSTITWHNQNGENRGVEVTEEIINLVKSIYKPKEILVESQIEVEDFIITEKIAGVPRSFKGVANVAYTKYQSTQLRKQYCQENDIHYDYVIMTRPDIIFHQPFDIDRFLCIYNKYGWNIPENGLFYAHNFFARGDAEDKHMIGGSDIIYFGNENVIDKATSLYESIKNNSLNKEVIEKDFYCFEIFWFNYWLTQGLEPIRIRYLQFSCFNIVRNEEEYSAALKNNQQANEDIRRIKVNTLNGYDENIKYIQSKRNNKSGGFILKTVREILKVLPYFMVHKKLKKINDRLRES